MRSWSEETEQTVSPSHWRQWRCTRLTWPQTLASFSVALRWTWYQIAPKALIKAVFPGSSQTLSKVHILRLQQRRGRSRTGICSCLFIFGKGEMAPESVFSSTRGKGLLRAVHNCRKSPTPGFLHSILNASCNIQSKTTLKRYTAHIPWRTKCLPSHLQYLHSPSQFGTCSSKSLFVCNTSEINFSLRLLVQGGQHQHTEKLNDFPKVTQEACGRAGYLTWVPWTPDKACIISLLFSGIPERHLTRTFVPSDSWVKDKKMT